MNGRSKKEKGPLQIEKSKASYLYDKEGGTYIDCISGVSHGMFMLEEVIFSILWRIKILITRLLIKMSCPCYRSNICYFVSSGTLPSQNYQCVPEADGDFWNWSDINNT